MARRLTIGCRLVYPTVPSVGIRKHLHKPHISTESYIFWYICFVSCQKVSHDVFPFIKNLLSWLYYAVHLAGGLLNMFGVQL